MKTTYSKTWFALLLSVANVPFIASSYGLVIHDRDGKAVEARAPADGTDLVPTGKGWGHRPGSSDSLNSPANSLPTSTSPFFTLAPGLKDSNTSANGINYHDGPLILGTVKIYYIWYGNWSDSTAVAILDNFASNIGGSPYYNINTTYYDGAGKYVSNAVSYQRFSNSVIDKYSRGPTLTDSDIRAIVVAQINSGALPQDSNAVYFVLTSVDVNGTSGFCTSYCGWHAHGTIRGSDIKYAFVGNPARCPSSCAAQSLSPNGNAGADAMVNVIAHELLKAVTNPELNAWFDHRGYENADKCAWKFGATYTTANGSKANMNLGGRDYLIQQNWVNAGGGYCAGAYP